MKRLAIVAALLVLFISISGTAQTISFEKQAISLVKKMPARSLDEGLPERPFADWFKELTGPDAGVVWQLSECGDHPAPERDLIACTEANAVLANGNKVVIAVSVGTFKKGLTGAPIFFRAVIERDNQLYQIRNLRSLPEMLRLSQKLHFVAPEMSPELSFPGLAKATPVTLALPLFAPPSHGEYLTPCSLGLTIAPDILTAIDERPGLMIPESSLLKVPEGVMRGIAIRKVRPVYPRAALKANSHGTVEVEIVVSEQGRVIEATAISGHPVLYSAAIDAVRKWVFKPTIVNGSRVKVQSSLTLLFDPVNQ
ncbi:MAG: energy transducer TonB [Blastocatellia bacterium]|nr:energy transducer TonB [Blastocatellia bacterium]